MIIHDNMQAPSYNSLVSSVAPTNAGALNTRAIEIADDFYRILVDDSPGRVVISGVRPFVPGPFIAEVAFRDLGDGVKTEVKRYWPDTRRIKAPMLHPIRDMVYGILFTAMTPATNALTGQTTCLLDVHVAETVSVTLKGTASFRVTLTNRSLFTAASKGTMVIAAVIYDEWAPIWVDCDVVCS